MFLHERLEKLNNKLMELEGEYMTTESNSDEEESISYILNDIESYIEKIEDILKN